MKEKCQGCLHAAKCDEVKSKLYDELKEYEEEERMINEEGCPYRGSIYYSCSPHDGNCSCWFNEDGKVFCEEIHDKIIYLVHKIDDLCLLEEQ